MCVDGPRGEQAKSGNKDAPNGSPASVTVTTPVAFALAKRCTTAGSPAGATFVRGAPECARTRPHVLAARRVEPVPTRVLVRRAADGLVRIVAAEPGDGADYSLSDYAADVRLAAMGDGTDEPRALIERVRRGSGGSRTRADGRVARARRARCAAQRAF